MPCPRRIFWEKQAHVFFREGIAPSSGRCGNSARSASDWSEPSPPGRGRRWGCGDPDFGWGRGRRPSGNGNGGPETEDGVGTGDRLIHFPGAGNRGRARCGTGAGSGAGCEDPFPGPGRAGPTSLARRRYRQHLCGGYWSRSPPIWILCSVPTILVSFFWKQCFFFFFLTWKYSSAPLASGSNFHAITPSFPLLCQGGYRAVYFGSLLPCPTWRELSGGGWFPPAGDGFSRERGARSPARFSPSGPRQEPRALAERLVCSVRGCGDRETRFFPRWSADLWEL